VCACVRACVCVCTDRGVVCVVCGVCGCVNGNGYGELAYVCVCDCVCICVRVCVRMCVHRS